MREIKTIEFTKVHAGDYNVRYIDPAGKWWHKQFNGQLKKSKPMPIHKIYGNVTLQVEYDDTFGNRIV